MICFYITDLVKKGKTKSIQLKLYSQKKKTFVVNFFTWTMHSETFVSVHVFVNLGLEDTKQWQLTDFWKNIVIFEK